MARLYRECESSNNYSITNPAQLIASISPIDADQIPNGYLKSAKITICPIEVGDAGSSFMVVASTNDTPSSASDWITAGSVGRGGGTVWLNLKRPVKSSVEELNRPDGEVFLHVLCQGANVVVDLPVFLAVECWGRFVNLELN